MVTSVADIIPTMTGQNFYFSPAPHSVGTDREDLVRAHTQAQVAYLACLTELELLSYVSIV